MSYLTARSFKQYTAVLVSLFLVSCATTPIQERQDPSSNNIIDKQYHPSDSEEETISVMKIVDGFSAVPKDDPEKYGHTYDYTSADLHYLEYKESGEKFDGVQLEVINRAIANSNKPVYLVIYVHGWHNNASIDPKSRSLDTTGFPYLLARRSFQKPDMNVIGVYIGWRGEETKSIPQTFLSLERRADAADAIGNKGDVKNDIKSLVSNVQINNSLGHSLIIGHSLGGRLLSRAFMEDLQQTKSVKDWPLGSNSLLVTLNSAISADAFNKVYENMPRPNPKSGMELQRPLWLNLTSKDDDATSKWAYRGRLLGLDILDEPNGNKKQTIGHYSPYISHEFTIDNSNPPDNLSDKCKFIQGSNGQLIPRGVELWFKIPLWDVNHGKPKSTNNITNKCDETRHVYRNEDYKRLDMRAPQFSKNYELYHTSILKPLYDDTDKDAKGFSKFKGPSIPLGYMWNFRVDKSVIDHSAQENKINKSKGVHNAFVQTTLGRMLDDMLFTAPESRTTYEKQLD